MSGSRNHTPERKILGKLNTPNSEPISPTANLRLLTSLASSIKTTSNQRNDCHSNYFQIEESSPIASSSKILPRKQKSLGLLCNKFLTMFPLNIENGPKEISLDGTAKLLGTEKRRIYDIINVLESLNMAKKAGKNRYQWHGQVNLTATLIKLKSIAIRLGLKEQIQEIQKTKKAFINDYEDSNFYSEEFNTSFDESVDDTSDATIREDKSLGAMCQKFIMLFLVSMKNGVINLDIAAKVLITDMDSNQPSNIVSSASRSHFKTKIRRLYDIANVLTAIGLITKVYMYDRTLKKPIFKYIGPDVDTGEVDTGGSITGMYSSPVAPVGMSTPNTKMSNYPRGFIADHSNYDQYILHGNESTSTPVTDKRRPRKRKLFDSESTFSRTYSSPNLHVKSRSLERVDDSILRVAEMELERLNSSEEYKPKACTKLFTRYNSDSCINNTNHETSGMVNKISLVPSDVNQTIPIIINSSSNILTRHDSLTLNPNHSIIIDSKTLSNLESKNLVRKKVIKLLPISQVLSLQSLSNQVILPASTSTSISISPSTSTSTNSSSNNSNSSGSSCINSNNYSSTKIERYQTDLNVKSLKVINLSNIDPTKFKPIKSSDLKISLTPINSLIVKNPSTSITNISCASPLNHIQPGDTFKAVKVGDSIQLVPIQNESPENSNKENKH